MDRQLLRPENAALFPEWDLEHVRNTFFKCIRWQVEETLDPLSCPYHYYCDSNYPGNYPPTVDVLVLIFATTSYLATLVLMVIDISRRGRTSVGQSKRYLLPSGPVSLPIFLLMLAKGHRINTIFPLSCIGPAILQLLYISALTFNNELVNEDVKYAFFEASTISGILHASVYLDSVILPYYTGFDALVSSRFSGECVSCVCRKEALVVGGKLVAYRGWHAISFYNCIPIMKNEKRFLSITNRQDYSGSKNVAGYSNVRLLEDQWPDEVVALLAALLRRVWTQTNRRVDFSLSSYCSP
ncbi:hypothetical protein Patl1_00724 [Pistacia atlantica]|uniref:Uncharacterized protein n=1 Tax=Pistacia atlantica TaxID=434234 RepID=A0ACC1C7H2_9ROSI|nr:hypothetical protein Patl1_00724 [Pistacia atlantica]